MGGASLVAQWLRILLAVQETWVRSLIWEDSICQVATKPVHCNYWACALDTKSCNYPHSRAHPLQQEKPPQWETCPLQPERVPLLQQLEKSHHSSEDPAEGLQKVINLKKNRMGNEKDTRLREMRTLPTTWNSLLVLEWNWNVDGRMQTGENLDASWWNLTSDHMKPGNYRNYRNF